MFFVHSFSFKQYNETSFYALVLRFYFVDSSKNTQYFCKLEKAFC